MTTEADIYRTAHLLISENGEMAAICAMAKADHLSSIGDKRGEQLWLRVVTAIEKFLYDIKSNKDATN